MAGRFNLGLGGHAGVGQSAKSAASISSRRLEHVPSTCEERKEVRLEYRWRGGEPRGEVGKASRSQIMKDYECQATNASIWRYIQRDLLLCIRLYPLGPCGFRHISKHLYGQL